jgi:hypothetical protein
MLDNLQAASVAGPGGESPTRNPECDGKVVYWHRELPPLDAEPLGEHTVEADSMRVAGGLARGSDLWDRCYRDLMAQVQHRLEQEVHRLGGHYAHVLEETTRSRHDYSTGEVWLRGVVKYVLLRRPRDR